MHDSRSSYMINPQPLHVTEKSVENTSTSTPHSGQFFIFSVGVLILAAPGHLSNTFISFIYKNFFVEQAGHNIFAHSRPDKIGTPRLLPLDLYEYFIGLSAKKSAQIPCPACLSWLVNNLFKIKVYINQFQ